MPWPSPATLHSLARRRCSERGVLGCEPVEFEWLVLTTDWLTALRLAERLSSLRPPSFRLNTTLLLREWLRLPELDPLRLRPPSTFDASST